jgi:Na+/H+-dicarboxylate symporter
MDVNIIIRITPIGITSLIAVSIANMTRIGSVFEQLGMFVVTVTIPEDFQSTLS